MHVLFNKENMSVVTKHQSSAVLLAFAWLELPHVPVKVCACDQPLNFDGLTDFELKLLYRSITDQTTISFSYDALLTLLWDAVSKIKELDAIESEIATQANKIVKSLTIYKYIKGSQEAKEMDDLYTPGISKVARDEALEAEVRTANPIKRVQIEDLPLATKFAERPKTINKPVVDKVDFSKVEALPIKQPWL